MDLDLPFTPEQEEIVTKELVAISKAFDLGELGLRGYTRECKIDFNYYLKENNIWRYELFTDTSDSRHTLKQNDIFADSINKVILEMWQTTIHLRVSRLGKEKLHQEFGSTYPITDWYSAYIQGKTKGLWLLLPKNLVVKQNFIIDKKHIPAINLNACEISLEVLKDFVDYQNRYDELHYEIERSIWQNIHQFINDQKMNERLGLQNPPFSLEIYKLRKKPTLDYRNLL